MKMKKFLAVVLLVAMCSSFMAVSASASGNGFNIGDFNPDGYGETPDTVVTPSEPEVPDVNAGGNGQADIIIGQDAGTDEIDGAIAVKPEDTKLKDSTVAVIGDKEFDTLEDAIKASAMGDTLKLNKDISASSVVFKTEGMVIDLNDHTITFTVRKGTEKEKVFSGHPVCLDIQRNTEIKNGTVKIVPETENESFLAQNPIMVSEAVTLKFDNNVKLVYDKNKFGGTQYDAFGGKGTVLDGTEEENGVLEVKGVKYNDFASAFAAANDGDTVKFLDNAGDESVLTISKNLTFDMGGFAIVNQSIVVPVGKSLTVTNGTVKDITVEGNVTLGENAVAGDINVTGEGMLNVNVASASANSVVAPGRVMNITAGTFNADPSQVIDGEKYIATNDGKGYVVSKKTPNTADIEGKGYETLKAAVEAANDGQTVTLNKDVTEDIEISGKHIYIDLGGNTLTGTTTVKEGAGLTVQNGNLGDIKVEGKLSVSDEKVKAGEVTKVGQSAELDIIAGTFKNRVEVGPDYTLKENEDHTFTVVKVEKAVITPENGKHVIGQKDDLKVTTTKAIESVKLDETEIETKNYDITDDKKTITFHADWLNTLTAGEYNIVFTFDANDIKTFKLTVTDKVDGSVTDASGKEISELKYFKGNSAMNNEFKFKTTPELNTLSVGNKVLTKGTDYDVLPNGVISIAKDAKFLSELNAGQHALKFALSNGNTVDIKLLVYPSVKFSATHYTKGSNTDIEITVSDMADDILFGSELKPIEDNYWSYDSNSGKYTVSSKFFEAQPEGELPMGLRYGEMSFTLNGFKVNGNATIKPYNYVDKDGKSVWPYGSDTLGFKVSPDVKGVTIDGTELTDKQYSVDKNGILWIAASKLQKLNYGKHSIVVNTSYGDVEGEFYTKVGVEPKNEDYHVKGGKKNLSFVSSEPVKEVYVGREVLKSSYYSLSKDRMTITLNADFMNRLKADVTYSLTVTTEAGNASCNFRILSPGSAANRPQTGDESNMLIWAAVMVLSGAAVVALVPRKKKN